METAKSNLWTTTEKCFKNDSRCVMWALFCVAITRSFLLNCLLRKTQEKIRVQIKKQHFVGSFFFIADYIYGRWPKDFAIFIFLINFFWASEKWWWTEKKKMHITMMAERENPCLISRPSMLRHNLMTKNALKKNAPIRSWWYLQLAFTCTYTH